MELHGRHRGPAGPRRARQPALAAAHQVGRRDHRLRLGRRHPLVAGRHRSPWRVSRRPPRSACSPTSPDYEAVTQNFGGGAGGAGGPSQATAVFDHLATSDGWTAGPWAGQYVGSPEEPGVVGYHQSGGQFTLTGQGDIAPVPAGHGGPADAAATVADYLIGTFAGLLAVVVVAALFVTAEYRRGLIRLTLAATPSRGRVLAAKSVVVAAVGFTVGLVGAGIAVLSGRRSPAPGATTPSRCPGWRRPG